MSANMDPARAAGSTVDAALAPAVARTFVIAGFSLATLVGTVAIAGLLYILGPLIGRRRARSLIGRVLAAACRVLGPTYVKAAQIASTRPDLISPELQAALEPLRTRVPPSGWYGRRGRLPPQLRAVAKAGGLIVETRAVAAGSIAEVFRAHDPASGRVIALKVKRPGVSRRFDADFATMRRLAGLLAHIPALNGVPVIDAITEVEALVRKQADFRREASNIRYFGETYRHAFPVVVPEVIEELSNDDVIAMSFVEGLHDRWMQDMDPVLGARMAETASRLLFDMVFAKGRIHADLHPGNLLILNSGRIVLLDAGMVAELTREERQLFVYFFFGLITNSAGMCAYVLMKTAVRRGPDFREELFRKEVATLVARYFALTARDFEVAAFVSDLFGVQRRHGLQPATNFLSAVLSFLMLEGMLKQLAPDFDFQDSARRYILRNAIACGLFAR
jgi:ubiquinone biosynthesis protein